MTVEERFMLSIVRGGSAKTAQTSFWSARKDDKLCDLCGKEEETSDHFWFCSCLQKVREEADEEIAKIDPQLLHCLYDMGLPQS